jgi:hypothetical protein
MPTTVPEISHSLKNPWSALLISKEKAARAGDDFQKSFLVAQLYDDARTYFQENI